MPRVGTYHTIASIVARGTPTNGADHHPVGIRFPVYPNRQWMESKQREGWSTLSVRISQQPFSHQSGCSVCNEAIPFHLTDAQTTLSSTAFGRLSRVCVSSSFHDVHPPPSPRMHKGVPIDSRDPMPGRGICRVSWNCCWQNSSMSTTMCRSRWYWTHPMNAIPSSGSPDTPEYNCSRPLVENPAWRRAEQQSTIFSTGVNGMAGFGWMGERHPSIRPLESCLRIAFRQSAHSVCQSPVARLYLSRNEPYWRNTKFPYLAHGQTFVFQWFGCVLHTHTQSHAYLYKFIACMHAYNSHKQKNNHNH